MDHTAAAPAQNFPKKVLTLDRGYDIIISKDKDKEIGKMMYVIMFYEDYVGYFNDRNCKVFANEAEARTYARKLNENLTKVFGGKVKDLGDYYEVIKMPLA